MECCTMSTDGYNGVAPPDPVPPGGEVTALAAVKAQEGVAKPTLHPSPGLGAWLNQSGGSLAFTTYQSARLFFVMADGQNHVLASERIVGTAMGLAWDAEGLWVSNQSQAWRFANIGPRTLGDMAADAVYMPRKGHLLGPCDTHDILAGVDFQGEKHELLFVSTHFNCIATLDNNYNFRPVWQPDFISATHTPDDRCHLNSMGTRDGVVTFASLCGRSDTPGGWRQMKAEGGMVLDIQKNRVLCQGLSMPHSPRWHDGRLWLLNSGVGEFGFIQEDRFVPLCLCPGFARGLCFVGHHALIGLSKMRPNSVGQGIALPERLAARNIRQMCGLLVVDLTTGKPAHWLTIEGEVTELYDVAFMPGVRRPFTPGFSLAPLHQTLLHLPAGDPPSHLRIPPQGTNFYGRTQP